MKTKISLKKLLVLTLCLVMTASLLSGAALAVETFTTSEACVEMIKELEGFRAEPYSGSNGKWYVGYAVECNPQDYPSGVTEAEADLMMRRHLVDDEALVNGFLLQYGISVTQYQFDALISMTYSLGAQWIDPRRWSMPSPHGATPARRYWRI